MQLKDFIEHRVRFLIKLGSDLTTEQQAELAELLQAQQAKQARRLVVVGNQ